MQPPAPFPAAPPIMVLASNRPLELAELLASLLRQEGAVIERRKIFLFQDGGLDASGARHWSDAVLLENVDIFRRLVPDGIPLPSYLHLGPVLTRDRAERFAFDDLQAEAAVLLGDDMILGRCYLRTLDRLLALASADPRIAQVSADGDPRASLADQRAHSSRLIPLGRAPGRGLLRRDWLRQRRYMDAYLRCARDPAAIRALFQGWGVDAADTSYEAALGHACALTGTIRLGSYACFGRRLSAPDAPAFDSGDSFAGPDWVEEDVCRPVPPGEHELASLMPLR